MKTTHEMYQFLALHARGRARAIKADALARAVRVNYDSSSAMGNGGGANLRRLVRAAVAEGFPICGGGDGYYVPETTTELREGLSELRSRAASLLKRAAALEVHHGRFYSGGRLVDART